MFPARWIGFVLVFIGLASGAVLVAQPFMAQLDIAPLTMALLFGGCLLAGLPLYASGPRRGLNLAMVSTALIALGAFSLLGIFVDGAGLLPALRPTLALWLIAPTTLAGGLLLNYFAGALARLGRDTGAD